MTDVLWKKWKISIKRLTKEAQIVYCRSILWLDNLNYEFKSWLVDSNYNFGRDWLIKLADKQTYTVR